MSQILPRNVQIVPLLKKGAKADIKPAIEQCFLSDDFIGEIEPFISNGGVNGHKLLDQRAMLETAKKFDRKGIIESAEMNELEKIQQLMVVVRRHYVLDKHARYVSVNPKRYALIETSAKPANDSAAAEAA